METMLNLLPESLLRWAWLAIAVATFVPLSLMGRFLLTLLRPKHPDLQAHLAENLAEYPPPPNRPASRRLTFEGTAVRLRLVVVAPMGRTEVSGDTVEALVDEVLRGLGRIIAEDKPRVKVWPTQLSAAGFGPTFHRLVRSPDAKGQPSRWIRVAGQARAVQKPILLGLALLADQPCETGERILQADQWPESLRVQSVTS